ncbi:endonuclease Q family protein [Candidatus Woesearchaeota archaeon]|nr:endonuclease Q family protein [Candidatus Woesearchaeota archaeon]
MTTIADLHIHSKYSRGCSKDLDIDNLEKYARIKGVGLLGTGDFTHPEWMKEIKTKLTGGDAAGDGTGVLRTSSGYPFIMQTEISLIYSQGGRGRRVHNVVLAPSVEVAEQITDALKKQGRVDYDGRPIFKIPCIDFVDMMQRISPDIEVIPAHIWTPWFSMFGSKSGFDTMKECFGDQLKHVHAIETGLSSDPPMNWRLSQLDKMQIVSFSDLHSYWPWRIGRESTILDADADKITYTAVLKAIRTGEGLTGTVEVDPAYGKYHEDGHRGCGVCMVPTETMRAGGICPKCNRPMTIGVHYRVEELADRPEGYVREGAKKFYKLIPLSELLATVYGRGIATKKIWEEYHKILKLGTEMDVLLNRSQEALQGVASENMVQAILRNREGRIQIKPGYDGVYGVPLFSEAERDYSGPQIMPAETPVKAKPAKEKNEITKDPSQRGLGEF